jgi:(1->4)-alpha-D-glucan 1-alpha-D-glucosylmutase
VPDTYQGTELWDFSLVDPDNRRPVDYARRRQMLDDLQAATAAAGPDLRELARGLAAAKDDGRVKLYVTWRALHCRRDRPGLFSAGAYLPLGPTGPRAEHVFAFARRAGQQWAAVAVPRLPTRLGDDAWQDTRLVLADVDPGLRWRNVFTGEVLNSAERDGQLSLAASDVFAHFPVALLVQDS